MKKIIAAAAISAALMTGCAQTNAAADGAPAGNAPELAGRTFVWQDAPKSQTMPTIAFAADGRVSGTSGCNRLVGGFTLEGKRIDLSKLGMTRMMCDPDSMKAETAFMGVLANARFVTETEKGLILWNEKGEALATLVAK